MTGRRAGRQPQRGGRSDTPGQRVTTQNPSSNTASLRGRVSAQHRAAGRAAVQVNAARRGRGQGNANQTVTGPSGQTTATTTTTQQTLPAAPILPTTPARANPLSLRPPPSTVSRSSPLATPHASFITVRIHTAKCDICNHHNTSILRRCRDCGWQICTPCWDARGGSGRHGTRRPFQGVVFSPSADNNQAPEEGNNAQASPEAGAVGQEDTEDEEVQAIQAALILESMQYARVLRPRQRRNYREPPAAVPSVVEDEEGDNNTGDDEEGNKAVSEYSPSQDDEVVVEPTPETTSRPTSTPSSHRLQAPQSANELGLWYLAEAAAEALEGLQDEAKNENETETNDEPPTPTPPARQPGRARPKVAPRLRQLYREAAKGPQGHQRRRDEDNGEGPSIASGLGSRA